MTSYRAADRESTTVATTIATTESATASHSTTPSVGTVSCNMVTPTMAATTGSTTVSVGRDAVSEPAWNARWFTTNPDAPSTTSAYGSQCSNAPKPWWSSSTTVDFVSAAVRPNTAPAVNANRTARRVPTDREATTMQAISTGVAIAPHANHARVEAKSRPPSVPARRTKTVRPMARMHAHANSARPSRRPAHHALRGKANRMPLVMTGW